MSPVPSTARMVRVEVADDLVVATLDDGKVNALGFQIVHELRAAVEVAVARRRPLVLAGRPGIFSAGFDLAVIEGADDRLVDELLEEARRLCLDLLGAPVPVVGACTGHAVAGGAVLLLCADHRIGPLFEADSEIGIGLNEVRLGMALPDFALALAADRLDRRRLAEATLFAGVSTPRDAVEVGFLHELADDPVAAALDYARALARLPAAPLATTRRVAHAPLIATLTGQSLRSSEEEPW